LSKVQPPLQDALFTTDFINHVLRSRLAGEQGIVSQVRQQPLLLGQSFNANLSRLYLTYSQNPPDAPHTLIAKLPSGTSELNERAQVFQPGSRESWFYRFAADPSPVRTPYCFYNAVDESSGQSILLLEDLAAPVQVSQLEGASLEQASTALKSIAKLHAHWWGKASSPEIRMLAGLLAGSWPDEQNLVEQLYDAAWPRFLEQQPAAIPEEVRQFGDAIAGRMKGIDDLIDLTPKTLVHGDFRLDNIFFDRQNQERSAFLIDWEDVFYGCGMVDVSWFLGGCLPVEQGSQELHLLRTYYQALVHAGVQEFSWEECYLGYRRGMCSSFVQGVLSSVVDEGADEAARALSRAASQRFIAAAQRLRLWELLQAQ
jgi:hypothetical protein